MLKNHVLISFLIVFFILHSNPSKVLAVENPLAVPNNKIGIHILFDHELPAASKLVNSTGGDWGYAAIVIQAGDKDLNKWQNLMNAAKKNHIIPIVRLSTEGDYFNTKVWRKPQDNDILDFANFLDSLDWPTKNRYVIVFNEVNRSDEWGGDLNPSEYAQFLSYAVTTFKSKNQDFFIISAGLDNAAPNLGNLYMNQYNYMLQMNNAVPGIFNQIDGLSSHSYPNPGFSQPPFINSPTSINSFQYEKALAKSLSSKDLPVFITETGWSNEVIPDSVIANYYKSALATTWNDPSIIAITPFLYQGSGSVFEKFSFIKPDSSFSKQYQALKNIPKIKGAPKLPDKVLSAKTNPADSKTQNDSKPVAFSKKPEQKQETVLPKQLTGIIKWLLKVE